MNGIIPAARSPYIRSQLELPRYYNINHIHMCSSSVPKPEHWCFVGGSFALYFNPGLCILCLLVDSLAFKIQLFDQHPFFPLLCM